MTAKQLASILGAAATLSIDGFKIPVTVSDVRMAFGRVDYLVTPIGGEGTRWVSAERIKTMVDGDDV